jgi:hypothetical protein
MAGDTIGPGPIIYPEILSDFLQQVLSAWQQMPEEDKHTIRVAVLHLNTSGTGFLDNRLFQVAQIWEYLADKWAPDEDLGGPEKELKRELKKCCSDWRKRHDPDPDPSGRLSGRVAFAFHWPVWKRRIQSLSTKFRLNLSNHGLDIDHLKAARDTTGHSISLEGVEASSGPHHELLLRAQRLVQIILLLKLGYNGLVIDHRNGCSFCEYIEKFLVE